MIYPVDSINIHLLNNWARWRLGSQKIKTEEVASRGVIFKTIIIVQSNLDYPDLDYPDFFSGPNFSMNINNLY